MWAICTAHVSAFYAVVPTRDEAVGSECSCGSPEELQIRTSVTRSFVPDVLTDRKNGQGQVNRGWLAGS